MSFFICRNIFYNSSHKKTAPPKIVSNFWGAVQGRAVTRPLLLYCRQYIVGNILYAILPIYSIS